jgi:hypothetical protein
MNSSIINLSNNLPTHEAHMYFLTAIVDHQNCIERFDEIYYELITAQHSDYHILLEIIRLLQQDFSSILDSLDLIVIDVIEKINKEFNTAFNSSSDMFNNTFQLLNNTEAKN